MNFFSGKTEEFAEYWQKELEKRTITQEEKKLIIEALNLLEKYYNYHKSQTYMESIKYKVDNLINKLGG